MNWVEFIENNQIDYVTRGPNTKRGEVSVKCPWCADNDPSFHLGIALESENWGCHRNAEHRGKNPVRLVAALLGCSWSAAKLITAQYSASDPETLEGALAALTGTPEPSKAADGPIRLPAEFTSIKRDSRFWRYLKNRGFSPTWEFIDQYNLTCCTVDRYKDRIIIPIYEDAQLVGWTGRALQKPVNAPRYLSSSAAIKQTVYNLDNLHGGEILFICEGPFDALKLDFYGAPATCTFGTSMTEAQIGKIMRLTYDYQHVVVLFDQGALEPAFSALDWLPRPNVVMGSLPDGFKDPGEMDETSIRKLVRKHVRGNP